MERRLTILNDNLRICAINPRWFDNKFHQGSTTLFDIERAVDAVTYFDSLEDCSVDFLLYAPDPGSEKISYPVYSGKVNLYFISFPKIKPGGVFHRLLKKLLIQTGTFFPFLYHMTPNFLFRVKRFIDKADIIYLAGTFNPFIFIYAKLHRKVVISDPYGIKTEAVKRAVRQTKGILWRILNFFYFFVWFVIELVISKFSDKIFMVSDEDKRILIRRFGIKRNNVACLCIPIRADKYRVFSAQEKKSILAGMGIGADKKVLVFAGHLDSQQNIHALQYIRNELAPYVLGQSVPAHFVIVGGWDKYGYLFHSDTHITFTGYTPYPEEFIGAADVCLSPHTIGGGVKQKVLCYLSCGRAVLATPEGSFGIDAENGRDIMIAPIAEYPVKLVQLLEDARLRDYLGANARELILEKYDYKKVNARRKEIFKEWGLFN